jgi:WD40 repeat protein
MFQPLAADRVPTELFQWSTTSGQLLRSFGNSFIVSALAISPDNRLILGGVGEDVVLWDSRTGAQLQTLTGHQGIVWAVAWQSDMRAVVSASYDKTVRYWDLKTGRTIHTFTHDDEVGSVAISPDKKKIAAGGSDTVMLWDVQTGSVLHRIGGHEGSSSAVAFSPDGKLLLTAGARGPIRLWNVSDLRQIRQFEGETGKILAVHFSPDGREALTIGDELWVWSVSNGEVIRRTWEPGEDALPALDAKFCPDPLGGPSRILVGSYNGIPRFFDEASGKETRRFAGDSNRFDDVWFSNDGKNMLVHARPNSVESWDLKGGVRRRVVELDTADSKFTEFSANGQSLVTVPPGEVVDVWDIASAKKFGHFTFSGNGGSVAISPDGKRVMTAEGPSAGDALASLLLGVRDYHLRLWDVTTGEAVRDFSESGTDSKVAFLATGEAIAATTLPSGGEDHQTLLWNVSDSKGLLRIPMASSVNAFTLSPSDGSVAISIAKDNAVVRLLSLNTGDEIYHLDLNSVKLPAAVTIPGANAAEIQEILAPTEIRFAPSGKKFLLAFGGLNVVLLVNSIDSKEDKALVGHEASVRSARFSLPQGRFVATASDDQTVKLWDSGSGKELSTIVSFRDGSWAVVNSEGRFDTNNLDEIRGLSWVFSDQPFRALPPEIFMRDYYQPKLLQKLLAGERLPAVRPLSDLSRAQPVVEVVRAEPEGGGNLTSVTVKVTNTHSDVQKDKNGKNLESGAFDLRLFRDGQLVGQWPEVSETAERSSTRMDSQVELESWRKTHEIKLVNGEYTHTFHHIPVRHRAGVEKVRFTAYAFNSDRVKSLTTPPLEYSLPKAEESTPAVVSRRAYLISMGVNANQSRWNLSFAVASAQDAARLIHEKLASEYEVVDISLFSTFAPDSPQVALQQATKANLKAILDLLAGRPVGEAQRNAVDAKHRIQVATPDDAVVLMISSHGYADPQGAFYVVPYDTGSSLGVTEELLTRCEVHPEDRSPQCERADAFLKRTISSQDFAAWWSGVDAGEMVMILDSCHSAAAPGRDFRPGPLGDAGLGQLSYDKGMQILTATQPDKTARATLVEELGHSLLVEALLDEAKAHPQEALAQWLRDTEQQVPVLTQRLYPELSEADVQMPELFDFAVTERHKTP